MDERKQREQDAAEPQDELKLPDNRVEDLEPDEDTSAKVQGGYKHTDTLD